MKQTEAVIVGSEGSYFTLKKAKKEREISFKVVLHFGTKGADYSLVYVGKFA